MINSKTLLLFISVIFVTSCASMKSIELYNSAIVIDQKGTLEYITLKSQTGYRISDIYLCSYIQQTRFHYRVVFENNIVQITCIDDSSGSSVLKGITETDTSIINRDSNTVISNSDQTIILIDSYDITARDKKKLGQYNLYFVLDSCYFYLSPHFNEQIQNVTSNIDEMYISFIDSTTGNKYLMMYNFKYKSMFRIQE